MLWKCHQIFSDTGDVLSGGEAEVRKGGTLHCALSCSLSAPQFKAWHKFQLAGDWVEHDVEGGFLEIAASGT